MTQPSEPITHRILLVDDNPSIHADFRKILRPAEGRNAADTDAIAEELFGEGSLLQSVGRFELDSAFQGQEALALVQTAQQEGRPYSLAFIDVRMPPGWDGIETIAQIWRVCSQIQMVICTAYSDYSWAEILEKLGETENLLILKKPFDNIEVLQLAHTLTRKWTLNRQANARLSELDEEVRRRNRELLEANQELQNEIQRRSKVELEQAKLEEQLRQSQKMEAIGQLAAGVAHDFNNLLTIIQGHSCLQLERDSLDADAQDAFTHIKMASERAAALTRQLLAFGRRKMVQRRPLDLASAIAQVKGLLSLALGESIRLECSLEPNLPCVNADPTDLDQVIMNLAVNSRDAMPDGGELSIVTREVNVSASEAAGHPDKRIGRFVELKVQDSGCGMDKEVLGRIFEPFFTTKPIGRGTGLGLSMVYGIVKQHEGWIEVESQPGIGTTFRVMLPACEGKAAETKPPLAPCRQSAGDRPRAAICVVEDQAQVREFISGVLTQAGYKVFQAASGAEALANWNDLAGKFRLLLTDLVMPDGISGTTLASRLIQREPGLKVIYISGYCPDRAAREEDMREGENFLSKPFTKDNLLAAVQYAFNSSNPVLDPDPAPAV